jgi:hypothetical protein
MNDHLLFEKHLADGLTDEESARLEAAVARDPAAARHLVAAARLDQRLSARLGPSPPPLACLAALHRARSATERILRWRRPLAIAAVLVALLGLATGVGAWIRSMGPHPSETSTAGPPRTTRPFVPARVTVAPDRSEDSPRLDSETPAMAALRRFLSSYYLTDLQLKQPLRLEEALGGLMKRVFEVNHFKSPLIEGLTAELQVGDSDNSQSDTRSVSLPFEQASLMDSLNWIGALTRSDVFLEEPGVITFRPWDPDENEMMVTEAVRVRPDLLDLPIAPDAPPAAAANAGSEGVGSNPFADSADPQSVQRQSPVALFQSWGLDFSEPASATYDQLTATLTVHHTASTIRAIKELLGIEGRGRAVMMNVHTKIFEFPDARSIKDELLTDEQFQLWLREINQTKGVSLLTAPQITMRSGQRGIVEVIKDHGSEGDWQGVRIPVEAVLEGEAVKVEGAVELRLPIDRLPGSLLFGKHPPTGELSTTATDFQVLIPRGQTAVFSVSESPDGPHFAVAVTASSYNLGTQRRDTPFESPGAAIPNEGGNAPK